MPNASQNDTFCSHKFPQISKDHTLGLLVNNFKMAW